MTWISELYSQHPYIMTLATYYVLSAFIGALPAPTATSGPWYRFFFTFSNTLGGNLLRALSTQIEKSPNFQAAVDIQTKQAGQPLINVQQPPPGMAAADIKNP